MEGGKERRRKGERGNEKLKREEERARKWKPGKWR